MDDIDQDSGAANSMLLLLLQLLIREEKKNQNRRSLKNSTATLVHSGTLPVCLASCVGQTSLLGSKPVVPVPGLGRLLLLFHIVVEGGIQGLQTTYHRFGQFVTISMGEQFMKHAP